VNDIKNGQNSEIQVARYATDGMWKHNLIATFAIVHQTMAHKGLPSVVCRH
jgi:hypothetical protein